MSWTTGRAIATPAMQGQFRKPLRKSVFLSLFCLSTLAGTARADSVALSKLDLGKATQGWGHPQADRSVDRHTMSIGGKSFATGVGAHARFGMHIQLDGQATEFTATVGVDDEIKNDPNVRDHPLEFQVICDDKVAYRSGMMHVGDAANPVRVDLKGVHTMILVVRPGGQGVTSSHANWAEAMIAFAGAAPVAISPPVEAAEVLTPKPVPAPRINCARAVGVRPGHPLLFLVATTGDRPMQFAADNLPEGLALDAASGRL
ncbi:MAG: alpha-galactosidase, partial [Phycisphaerales bacterium]|nr:alpha-galactosidase [Phycisphaerales bacterium]